jgi:hypothetical protein
MTFDDTRDNTTAIETTIIEADKLAREESAPYPPPYPFPVFGGEPDPAGVQLEIRPVKVADPEDPEHDPIGDADTEYDIEFDDEDGDGQPSEYEEWQDYMGGDDWDQGQYDDFG